MRIADFPVFPPRVRRVVEQPPVYRWMFAGLPPSTNNAYINGAHGGRVLSPAAREWKAGAVSILIGTSVGLRLPTEPLAIHIRLYPGNKRKWDVDGKQKLVIDALVESGVLDDDNRERVAYVTVEAMPVEKVARTEVAVETFARWRQRDGSGPWA